MGDRAISVQAIGDQAKGLLITVIGVLFVVPDSLFIRLIDAPPLEISFWRNALAGALLLGFVLVRGGTGPRKALAATGWAGAYYMLALGGSGILFTLAVSLTSVANVVFIIASMPVFAAIMSRVFLGEAISGRMIWTMAFVLLGLALILRGSQSAGNVRASLAGDALALGVSALFASALTAARRAKAASLVPLVPLAYLLSSAVLLAFVLPFEISAAQAHLVLLHGAFIAISSVGLALGPRYITSAEVALLILLESVLAPLLVWFWLGEDPGPWALAGGAVVIGALAVSNTLALRRRA